MTYSESELDSNFVINSVSDFDFASESDSESRHKSRHLHFLYPVFTLL